METVSLLKVESYEAGLSGKIEQLLEPLGGLTAFCKSGERVLLKPNFVLPKAVETATTTHPALIMAMVTLLHELGCKVAVGDSPGLGSSEGILRKIGIAEDLKRCGAEIVELETPVPFNLQRSLQFDRKFKNLQLAGEIYQFDKIINLAKLKSHGQMGISLATKNLFGCVAGPGKGQWHFAAGRDLQSFARLLVEIALTANPVLHIVDGIIGMDGNGPTNGRARPLDLLVAGTNPVAVDRVIVELIQQKPDQFPIFAAAREMGLPGIDLDQIEVKGEAVADCLIEDFQIPAMVQLDRIINKELVWLAEMLLKQRLQLDRKLCINCRKCEELCPAHAIQFQNGIKINEKVCIKCCCCQEMCPVGALHVSDPWTLKLVRKLGSR